MMSDASQMVERIRFPELAVALQKDETLSNEARVKLINLMNVYSPAHDVSYIRTVQRFVGKAPMARAVDHLIKDQQAKEKPKADISFDDSDDEDPEPPPKKPKPVDEEPPLNTDDDCDDADPLPILPGERLVAPQGIVPEKRHGGLCMIAPQHLAPARPDPPKKKPKVDHLNTYGSHELVLTHHMQLPAGFTIETDEEQKVQIIVPKRTKSNELKSFRARFGKHLRAIGFVCIKDDDEKPVGESAFPDLKVCERLYNGWVRSTVDADGKDVTLNPLTLMVKSDDAIPALVTDVDPLDAI